MRNSWLVLSAIVALIAWQLTRWITYVNHEPASVVTVVFDQRPWFRFEPFTVGSSILREQSQPIPEIAFAGSGIVLMSVTPATRSITVRTGNSDTIACGSSEQNGGAGETVLPLAVERRSAETFIPIDDRIRRFLERSQNARATIRCVFPRELAQAVTFTERAITLRSEIGARGAVLLDFAALEDIDDLRFSGGIQIPLGGDRVRLLYGSEKVVSAEWVDVSAQEQRDIILVLIGALSAIAASMAIEGVRPFVERNAR